ncbi:MAG: hypothetical protein ACRDJM_02535 [Actinomycetota bacterium]
MDRTAPNLYHCGMFIKSIISAAAVLTAFAAPLQSGAHGAAVTAPRIAQFTVLPGAVAQAASQSGNLQPLGCSPRSSEPNAADVGPATQTQIIYFVPNGEIDECLDQGPLIGSMNSLNAFFSAQGLGALRVDRVSNPTTGAMDIPFVRGNNTQGSYTGVSPIASELSSRGYNVSGKRYIIFATVDRGGVCGQAEFPGRYAVFFLNSAEGCGVRDFGDGTLAGAGAAEVVSGQEILHNEGVVSLFAPNGCQVSLLHFGHVCTPGGVLVEFGQLDPESVDIMFPYAIPGLRLSQKVVDRNRDDYFQTSDNIWPVNLIDLEDSPYFL